jgi:hypothetical protein
LTPGASGSRRKWKAIIEGRLDGHNLGYYCVRLPDDDERARKITQEQALQVAADFFDNTSPWNGFADRSRFGIPNLVSDISLLLIGLIESK